MIVGAGLAGLIAAHAFPRHQIIETQAEPTANHKALLRFRSRAVADIVGIEFRPVTVRKGIWCGGQWRSPSIALANRYAKKVVGRLTDRSIWNTKDETRWIAPETLYEQLLDAVGRRISWNTRAEFVGAAEPLISTAPMPVVLAALGIPTEHTFARSPIEVQRFRIPDADVYQTVYFIARDHDLYRASITGDLLICEFAGSHIHGFDEWRMDVADAFALDMDAIIPLDTASQQFGKIAPIDEATRRAIVAMLTEQHNIYSLGRYATWRNILLDDVVNDIAVVKRLINSTAYERKLKSL